jgi:hypothetical protein
VENGRLKTWKKMSSMLSSVLVTMMGSDIKAKAGRCVEI